MLLAVAQQEDEVPSVRREAIAALVALLEDDKRKVEVSNPGSCKKHDCNVRSPGAASSEDSCNVEAHSMIDTRSLHLQLADRGGLPVLVGLSETDEAWLRDLRAASMPWSDHRRYVDRASSEVVGTSVVLACAACGQRGPAGAGGAE
jgi:hypothetical protein